MGGCFSGQKGLEPENAPVLPPASLKTVEAEPVSAAPPTENVEEMPLVDVSETKEEVKEDAEAVPKEAAAVAEPVAEAHAAGVDEDKAPEAVTDEEAKVVRSEDKTSATPAAV